MENYAKITVANTCVRESLRLSLTQDHTLPQRALPLSAICGVYRNKVTDDFVLTA